MGVAFLSLFWNLSIATQFLYWFHMANKPHYIQRLIYSLFSREPFFLHVGTLKRVMIFSGIAALKFPAMGTVPPSFQSNYIKATLMGVFQLRSQNCNVCVFLFFGRNETGWNMVADELVIGTFVKTQGLRSWWCEKTEMKMNYNGGFRVLSMLTTFTAPSEMDVK